MGRERRILRKGVATTAVSFYRAALLALREKGVPFLVGGGYAFASYTGIDREKKDLDLFVRPRDVDATLGTLARAGFDVELVAPHWLGKVYRGEHFIDIVFSSGNGVAAVDDEWFAHAETMEILGVDVLASPVEEMIWSKAFILERERFDGGDVTHLIRARGERLDWERLVRRFEPHWHVLFAHLLLFRFAYPCHRSLVPDRVIRALLERLEHETDAAAPDERVCRGTLLSAKQYLVDVEQWDYRDGRLGPEGPMTSTDIEILNRHLQAEAARDPKRAQAGGRR